MKPTLIFDDDPTLGEVLVDLIRFEGVAAVHTNDKETFFALLRSGHFTNVLIDCHGCLREDGDLFNFVKEHKQRYNIYIMSGDFEQEEKAKKLGVQFLEKPFDLFALKAA